jgi:hypothetical protein
MRRNPPSGGTGETIMNDSNFNRRDFLKASAAVSGIALAGAAVANRHPHPRPTSLQYLDRNMYRKNTDVLAHYGQGQHRVGKMQMMAIGERRFMFQQGDVIEITNPYKPVLLGRNAFLGGQVQLGYNNKLGKWILMTGRGSRATFTTPEWPHGKYDNPLLIDGNLKETGLRGVRFYDASNPEKLVLLSQWSCDQGDPTRQVQTGAGVHRSYYDGGRYAYLDAGPDNREITVIAAAASARTIRRTSRRRASRIRTSPRIRFSTRACNCSTWPIQQIRKTLATLYRRRPATSINTTAIRATPTTCSSNGIEN